MLKKPAAERLRLLRNAEGRTRPVPVGHSAQQLSLRGHRIWKRLPNRARDVDQAMRWAFGHGAGPVRAVARAGWLDVAQMIQEDIDAGKRCARRRCPVGV